MLNQNDIDKTIESGTLEDIAQLVEDTNDSIDDGRWIIGDACLSAGERFTEASIVQIAIDSKMNDKTLYEYRQMSAFYRQDMRAHIKVTYAVNWSMMRLAMRVCEDIEDAIDFFDYCAQNNYKTWKSVLMASQEWKGDSSKSKKQQIGRMMGSILPPNAQIEDGARVITILCYDDLYEQLTIDTDYEFVIFAVTQAESEISSYTMLENIDDIQIEK